MFRVPEPRTVLQHSDPRGGEKSHLRGELARLFAAVIEFGREIAIEENHGVTNGHAVLRAAKAKNIDARLPRDFLRSAAQRSDRIRKARAIHVHAESVRFG